MWAPCDIVGLMRTANSKFEWGFLRETRERAKKDGVDKDTGLCRTGLEDYLAVIFPRTDDWIHDKITGLPKPDGKASRTRPDYRSESLQLIIEFDGIQHYTSPEKIRTDRKNTDFYESHGYRVIRLPYFIQLTESVVERMFGVKVGHTLFDGQVPSMGLQGRNTPAFLCMAGIRRMAQVFSHYPEQYEVNLTALKAANDDELTEWQLLDREYRALQGHSGTHSSVAR